MVMVERKHERRIETSRSPTASSGNSAKGFVSSTSPLIRAKTEIIEESGESSLRRG